MSRLNTGATLFLSALLAACGGQVVDFPLDAGSTPDTAPTVTATLPAKDATGVAFNTGLSATFSQAMDAATITSAAFTLKQDVTPVSGSVAYDAASKTATFTPDAELEADLVYTATVTTDVKNTDGLAMEAAHTWGFTTALNALAPEVASNTPLHDTTDVALDVAPTVTFTKAMDPASITALTLTMKQGATPVTGAVALNGATNTATFTPAAALSNGLVYTVTVTSGVKDSGGLALAANHSWTFTSKAVASAPPTVASTTPANLATGVARDASPTATFSKAMDAATLTATSFLVKQGATAVAGAVTYVAATRTAVFNPTALLAEGLVYTATVTTAAEDAGGLALAADRTWSFTTVSTRPTVVSNTPLNLAANVAAAVTPTVTFSKAMDAATVESTFTLKQGATNVAGDVALNAATNTATFTPDAALTNGLVYTATVTTGAKSSAGVEMAANHSWTFTVASLPTVASTTPLNSATGVSATKKPTAIFSKAMDQATVTPLTFTLEQDQTPVLGAVTYVAATKTATFAPTLALTDGLVYTATITTGAKDTTGLALAADHTWSFTIVANGIAPEVDFTTPLDLATNVPSDEEPTATFNTAMDSTTITDQTFTLAQGLNPVSGVVTFDVLTDIATFTPNDPLENGVEYTATITTGAEDTSGLALEQDHVWSFTTGSAAPMVVSTSPEHEGIDVTINKRPTAEFNRAMDPNTINSASYTVKQGLTFIPGEVTYDTLTNTATFTPDAPFGLNLEYTATITTEARDENGVALESDHVWTFTTSACSQLPITLGTAINMAVHAGSTVTNTGPTVITGNLSLSPGSAVDGFPPGEVVGTQHKTDTMAAAVAFDLTVAYNEAAGRTLCPVTKIGNIGGQTLPPGLYKSTGSMEISGSDLTLDAEGDTEAVFIFQIASTLETAAGMKVVLIGGAKSANVFWQVGTSAILATTTEFQGTIMADQAITLNTGASLNGRALARIAAVNLADNAVTLPAP